MLAEAKRECDRILGEAREQAVREASQTEIVKLAERQAGDIVDDARRQARETRLEMEDWADSILSTLEVNLDKFLGRRQARPRAAARALAGVGRRRRRRRRREHERRLPALGAARWTPTWPSRASATGAATPTGRCPRTCSAGSSTAGRVERQLEERPAVAVRGRRDATRRRSGSRSSSTRPRTSRRAPSPSRSRPRAAGYALDVGRAMQNMFLVAWNEGVVSCPNGMHGPGGRGPRARPRRGLAAGEHPELRLPEAPARPGVEERRGVERGGEPQAARRADSAHLEVATVVEMTTLDLRRLKLRSGDQYRDEQEIELEPFELGGQRYLPVPGTVPAELTVTRASTGTVFELRFDARLHGPCFRCLEDAVLDVPVSAREYQAASPGDDEELRTIYLDERQARPLGLGARRGRARAAGQDPLQARLRRPLPGLRQEPERRAARARRARAGLALGRARRAQREALVVAAVAAAAAAAAA